MAPAYTPRRFDQSPLFNLVSLHYEDFRDQYHQHCSERFGRLRSIVTHTVNRFLLCGDPREGVARYECGACGEGIFVPFSCKTRLFCPTCHEKKILIWVEEIQKELLLPVPHRFWTFSVPKRLRYYFMRNRRLLGLMVQAACSTVCKSLCDGRIAAGLRPGIVSLIQTHGDSLDWNSHLHLIVTDGLVDYSDIRRPHFKPCRYWDPRAMVQLFRFELIEAMFKAGVLTAEIADNLLSWRHSGFHVHATAPFKPDDDGGELLRNRLAYAFRPAVSLNRLSFDGERVRYRSRRQILDLTPVEFLARLTLHIPDRYQNIRRYAGFYSSVVQRKVRAARCKGANIAIDEGRPVKPSWARLIARVFGAIPIACPRCGKAMELYEFILDGMRIEAEFPELARAPPRKQFDRYAVPIGEFAYAPADDFATGARSDEIANYDQTRPERDEDFNQDHGG
jgi:hypothetical protein